MAAIITTFVASFFIDMPKEIALKIYDKYINSELYEEDIKSKRLDNEIKQIELEERKIEFNKKKKELLDKKDSLKENIKIKKGVSNFYENSNKYNKINKIGFQIYNQKKETQTSEIIINKPLFKNYIITNEKLEPIIQNDVEIEIVAPVLKKGANFQWKVLINGIPENVKMESNKFKNLIQAGIIEFKNGSKVICELEIKRKYNAKGIIKATSYTILKIQKYIVDSKIIDIEKYTV